MSIKMEADEISRNTESGAADEFFKHLNLSKSTDLAKKSCQHPPKLQSNRITRKRIKRCSLKTDSRKRACEEADGIACEDGYGKFKKHDSQALMFNDSDANDRSRDCSSSSQNKEKSGDSEGMVSAQKMSEVDLISSTETNETRNNEPSVDSQLLKIEVKKGTNEEILREEETLKKKMKSPPYRCLVTSCAKIFNKWEKFIRHFRQHQSSFPYTCTQCGAKFRCRVDITSHLKRHFGMRSIRCDICGDQFEKKRSLLSHMIAKHGNEDPRPRNFKCTECGQAFLSKSAVDRHMSFHTGYKPEVCQYCNASFHTEYDLKEHLRIHSGEKPFKCDRCDYCARTSQLLNRHKKCHSEEKPFHCKKCDFSCNNSQSLKRHSLTHTGKMPYKCPYCDHRCRDMDNLKKHIRKVKKHKGLKIYPCTKCPFSTDEGPEFLHHIKQHHYPYLDLRTTNAVTLSGILVEDVSEPEETPGNGSSNTIFHDPTYPFLHSCEIPEESNLCNIEQSPNTTEQYSDSLGAPFDKISSGETNYTSLSTVNSCNKGDILLSSVASNDHDSTRKEGAFPSGTFDINSCWVPPLCNTTTAHCTSDIVTNDDSKKETVKEGMDTHERYIAVLVEWPAGQKIELQHGNVGGVSLPLDDGGHVKVDVSERQSNDGACSALPRPTTVSVSNSLVDSESLTFSTSGS